MLPGHCPVSDLGLKSEKHTGSPVRVGPQQQDAPSSGPSAGIPSCAAQGFSPPPAMAHFLINSPGPAARCWGGNVITEQV